MPITFREFGLGRPRADRDRMMRVIMAQRGRGRGNPFDDDDNSIGDFAAELENVMDDVPDFGFGDADDTFDEDAAPGDAENNDGDDDGRRPGAAEDDVDEAEPMEGEQNGEVDASAEERGDVLKRETHILNIAAAKGGVEVLRILLDLGAIPKGDVLSDAVRYIAKSIGRAVYSSNVSMLSVGAGMACIEALLEAGADINAEDPDTKGTPLHVAATNKCHEVLSMLLERGANPRKRDGEEYTAAELAEHYDDPIAVDILTRFARLQRLSTFNRSASQRERNESQENAEELAEDLVCVLCRTEKKEVILAPCGHKILCRRCTKRLLTRPEAERKCPMCRTKLESFVVQIFES
jgi:rubrerythrin